jgi:hypothetical protein
MQKIFNWQKQTIEAKKKAAAFFVLAVLKNAFATHALFL